MPTICERCHKRNSCTELCCDAELYASLDHVKPKEKLIGRPQYGQPWPELPESTPLTDTEKKILRLLGAGLSRQETSQILEMTTNTLYQHIHNMRQKLKIFNY